MWSQDCRILGCARTSDENGCRLSFSLLALSQLLFYTFSVAAVAISTYIERSFTSNDKQGRKLLLAVESKLTWSWQCNNSNSKATMEAEDKLSTGTINLFSVTVAKAFRHHAAL